MPAVHLMCWLPVGGNPFKLRGLSHTELRVFASERGLCQMSVWHYTIAMAPPQLSSVYELENILPCGTVGYGIILTAAKVVERFLCCPAYNKKVEFEECFSYGRIF
jgi:hypothetical protein